MIQAEACGGVGLLLFLGFASTEITGPVERDSEQNLPICMYQHLQILELCLDGLGSFTPKE